MKLSSLNAILVSGACNSLHPLWMQQYEPAFYSILRRL
jgi:hypothetical protein